MKKESEKYFYKIDKNIPYRRETAFFRAPQGSVFPFDDMQVGDSFFVPWDHSPATMSAVTFYNRKSRNKRMVSAKYKNGRRVWRIK